MSPVERLGDCHPPTNQGATVGACYRQVNAKFVKKDQVFDCQRRLFLSERGALLRVGFGGKF